MDPESKPPPAALPADVRSEHLLAAYGTLRPGEVNHRLLVDVPGQWLDGWVRGHRGEEEGYPAFWYAEDGPRHPVKVFHSAHLPEIWPHLDWFEGKGWPRRLVPIEMADGTVVKANFYQRVGEPPQ